MGRRRTLTRSLVRAAVFGAGGVLVLLLLVWAGRAFMNAGMFRIDEVHVRGNERLSAEQVRAHLAGITQESLFQIDLAAYRARVLESKWVADAVLRRVFPSAVEVRVSERVPLAIAHLNGQLYLVDATGVIDSFGPKYPEFDLPIVDGLLQDARKGLAIDPQRIQLTARLLSEVSADPDLFRRLSQIDVSDPRNAVVLLEGEPALLRLGDEQFLERLRKYQEVADTPQAQGTVADYWDLRPTHAVFRPARVSPDARKAVAAK